MAYDDLTPSNRFEMALSGDMTAEEASNRIEKILAGADIEPSNRLEYFLKLRVSEGGGGGGDSWDFLDMSQPAGPISSDITTLPSGAEEYIFSGRNGITEISLPELTRFYSHTFYGAFAKNIYIPKADNGSYESSAFDGCANLESIALPSVTHAPGNYYFRNCPNLEAADLSDISSFFQAGHFQNDAKLKTLVLRRSSVTALGNTSTFDGTPFASDGSGGTLYVPQALISQYEAASNWSTILGYANNQIKAIEGSIYENTYVDGTPIS